MNNSGQKEPRDYTGAEITFNTPASTTIGSSSTTAIAANLDRKYLSVTNDSDEVMYLSFGVAAQMNKGIRLNANGGSLEWIGEKVFANALYAICSSGSKNLAYQEGQ